MNVLLNLFILLHVDGLLLVKDRNVTQKKLSMNVHLLSAHGLKLVFVNQLLLRIIVKMKKLVAPV